MRPIRPQPEPAGFIRNVKTPGNALLAQLKITAAARMAAEAASQKKKRGPKPLNPYGIYGKDIDPLWNMHLDDMFELYHSICSYLGVRIQRGAGVRHVDHFKPKAIYPDLSYEWTNYRLSCSEMNRRKGSNEDVIDPFTLPPNWFQLELVGLQVIPNPDLGREDIATIQATIDRLQLNDYECRSARAEHYDEYIADGSIDRLRRWAPFVADEVVRQAVDVRLARAKYRAPARDDDIIRIAP